MTEQLRIWAGLQGFMALAALVALALFFALATPFASMNRQWSWLGPVNDWLSVLGAIPWIVAMLMLARHIHAGAALWVLTTVACLGVVALAVVTLLMLAGRTSLQLQSAVAVPVTVVTFVWTALAGAVGRESGAIESWVAAAATGMLVALLIGAAAAGLAFLAPADSSVRTVLVVAGACVGGLAWLAFPVWWLAVASTVQ